MVTKQGGVDTASSTVDQFTTQNPSNCETLSTLPTDFDGTTPPSTTGTCLRAPRSRLRTSFRARIANFSGSGGFAFTAMDSSEADFYGLLPASLQNAAGEFEPPDPSSVLAALNDETANPDGTLSPNYNNTGDAGRLPHAHGDLRPDLDGPPADHGRRRRS